MEKYYSQEQPTQIVESRFYRIIAFNVYLVEEEEIQSLWDDMTSKSEEEFPKYPDDYFKELHKYGYYQVQVPMGQWTYEGIVNAIIRDKYSIDAMEAITNNMAAINAVFMQTLVSEGIVAATKYLKDSINDENTANFKEMQEWRKMAKEVAKSIIKQ